MNRPSNVSQIKDAPTSRLERRIRPVPLSADIGLQDGYHHQHDQKEDPEGEGDLGERLLPVCPWSAGVAGGQKVVGEGSHERKEELRAQGGVDAQCIGHTGQGEVWCEAMERMGGGAWVYDDTYAHTYIHNTYKY